MTQKFDTKKIIKLGLADIQANGYIKANYEGSTKDKIMSLYEDPDAPMATEAECNDFLHWVNNLDVKSDYERSSKIACNLEECKAKDLGFILSFISKFYRDRARAAEKIQREIQRAREAQASDYLGQVGDKVEFTVKSYRALYSIEPYAYNDDYKTAYRIIDENDNIIIWKTPYKVHEGDVIKATIKSVGMYRGEKQTTVFRGKFLNYVDEDTEEDDYGVALESLVYDIID